MLVCVGRQSSFSVKQPRDMTLKKLALVLRNSAFFRTTLHPTDAKETPRHVYDRHYVRFQIQLLDALAVPVGKPPFEATSATLQTRDTSGLPGP